MSKKSDATSWLRVTGPNLSPDSIERGKKNEAVMNSAQFKEACENVKLPVTRRQASKFRRKMGKAYQNRNLK